jgi:hypothetical protein
MCVADANPTRSEVNATHGQERFPCTTSKAARSRKAVTSSAYDDPREAGYDRPTTMTRVAALLLLILAACSKETSPAGPVGTSMDLRSYLEPEVRARSCR